MLNISKVETFYGNIQALRGVDVKVNDGEIVALIGSNGAGKSTLLMTISGVNKAATGDINFENRENLISKLGYPSYIDPIENKFFYFSEKSEKKSFFTRDVEYSYVFVFSIISHTILSFVKLRI